MKRRNLTNRDVNPLSHLLRWNRIPCIAAVPTGDIESRLRGFSFLSELRQVVCFAPFLKAPTFVLGSPRNVIEVIVV